MGTDGYNTSPIQAYIGTRTYNVTGTNYGHIDRSEMVFYIGNNPFKEGSSASSYDNYGPDRFNFIGNEYRLNVKAVFPSTGVSGNGKQALDDVAGQVTNSDCALFIGTNKNVGIGTTSPKERLDVGNGKICFQGSQFGGTCGISYYYGTQSTERPILLFDSNGSTVIRCTDNNDTDGIRFQSYGGTERMIIRHDGRVGIGTSSPYMPLDVATSRQVPDADIDQYWDRGIGDGAFFRTEGDNFAGSYQFNSNQARTGDLNDEADSTSPVNLKPISAHFYDNVYISNGGLLVSSDERIKQNITEISDDISLKILRDISCCSYYYIDDIGRQKAPTLGFIAQQVNKIFPQAVTLTERIIPNVMKRINNLNWVSDNSNNTHKLISDLQDVSGVLYRFYVSNNDDEMEKRVEHIGNSDNTFTFENKWERIFCYGYEVRIFTH